MQPNDTARYAYQYLINKGLSPAAAAGAVGNFAVESGNFSPDVLSGQRRGDKGTAWYVQQLRGDRLEKFRKFTQDNKLDPTSLDAQLDFFIEETTPGSRYADSIAVANRDSFLAVDNPKVAAHNLMTHYERASKDPKLNHLQTRLDYAQKLIGQEVKDFDGPRDLGLPTADNKENKGGYSTEAMRDMAASFGTPGGNGLIMAGQIMQGRSPSLSPASAPSLGGFAGDTGGNDSFTTTPVGYAPGEIKSGPGEAVQIGIDQALPASTKTQFGLKAVHRGVDLDGINEQTRHAAAIAASRVGRDIPVTSAFRSQAKQDRIRNNGDPNRITVADKSFHTKGDALDIPISDMTDEQVSELVDALAGAGFTGFGYYGKDGHLHADMRSSVPKSFNPDTGWGGWTSLPPHVMRALVARGFMPGLAGDRIQRGWAQAGM